MKLNDFFGNVYVINLARRTDRMENAKKQCDKIGIDFQRWEAIDAQRLSFTNPEMFMEKFREPLNLINRFTLGCYALRETFCDILRDALKNGYENVLILEDDIVFSDDAMEIMEKAIGQLPNDWEYVNFGGYHFKKPTAYTENLVKVNGIWHAQCLLISKKALVQTLHDVENNFRPADLTIGMDLSKKGHFYAPIPQVAFQLTNKSDITGEEDLCTNIPRDPFSCIELTPIEELMRSDPSVTAEFMARHLGLIK